jgi:hypothetical protein
MEEEPFGEDALSDNAVPSGPQGESSLRIEKSGSMDGLQQPAHYVSQPSGRNTSAQFPKLEARNYNFIAALKTLPPLPDESENETLQPILRCPCCSKSLVEEDFFECLYCPGPFVGCADCWEKKHSAGQIHLCAIWNKYHRRRFHEPRVPPCPPKLTAIGICTKRGHQKTLNVSVITRKCGQLDANLVLQICDCPEYLGVVDQPIAARKRLDIEQIIELGFFPTTSERIETLVSLEILDDRYRRLVHDRSRMNGFVKTLLDETDGVKQRYNR